MESIKVQNQSNNNSEIYHSYLQGVKHGHNSSGTEVSCGSLGNNTKSTVTPEVEKNTKRRAARANRYSLRDKAAEILGRHRVASCQKVPSYGVQQGTGSRGIAISEGGNASFYGVGSCGNIWVCPVCGPRVVEGRRLELLSALRKHRENGYIALLVTYTFAHTRVEGLKEQLACFATALSRMKGSRKYRLLRDRLLMNGSVRALEITHSDRNGWHPHVHELWFVERGSITDKELTLVIDEVYALWSHYAVKSGLGKPSREHGVDIQWRPNDDDSEIVGSYVAKWGHELTYSHMKSGGGGSRTPWDILADLDKKHTHKDVKLFREYAAAIQGRRQLFWSNGLKAKYEVEEVADTELADKPEPVHVMDLDAKQWGAIVKQNAYAKVLDIAETAPELLPDFIEQLVDNMADRLTERILLKRKISKSTEHHLYKLEYGFV